MSFVSFLAACAAKSLTNKTHTYIFARAGQKYKSTQYKTIM